MPDWKMWREMSLETFISARELENVSRRNAISRYYYAAYQMASAYLLYRGLQPPQEREAWSHAETPGMLRENLKLVLKSEDKRKDLANRLGLLYKMRCDADYVSVFQPAKELVAKARKDADHLRKSTEEHLPRK